MQNYLQQPQFARPMFYKALPIANEAEMNNYTVDFNGMPTYSDAFEKGGKIWQLKQEISEQV